MSTINKDLGMVTAYAYAKAGGYTGTEAEFEELLGSIADTLEEFENFSVTVTTLPAGSSATASYADGVLSLGIPKGDKGDQGDRGETGLTPDFSIGTVETLQPGESATATITGTDESPVLNLGIPQGIKGDPGDVNATGTYPDLTAGNALQILSDTGVEDQDPYNFRAMPEGAGNRLELNAVVGATVAWNQLAQEVDSPYWDSNATSVTFSGNVATIEETSVTGSYRTLALQGNYRLTGKIDHIFVIIASVQTSNEFALFPDGSASGGGLNYSTAGEYSTKKIVRFVWKCQTSSLIPIQFRAYTGSGVTADIWMSVGDVMVTDLTSALNPSIADKVYSMETTTPGSGIEWLRSYSFLTEDYYAYCEPALESVQVSEHKTTGKNWFDKTATDTTKGYVADSYVGSAGSINGSQNYNVSEYIRIAPNTNYTVSGTTGGNPALAFYDSGKAFISGEAYNSRSSVSFTTPTNAMYVRLSVPKASVDVFQLELGSTATAYTEYEEHTYALDPVTLDGVFQLVDGELVAYGDRYTPDGIERKFAMVDLGTLPWGKGSDEPFYKVNTNTDVLPTALFASPGVTANIFCAYTPTNNYNAVLTGNEGIAVFANGTNRYVRIADSRFDGKTADQVKAMLSGVKLLYEALTPTTEQATTYQKLQICDADGTEAFTDYAVAQSNRDVAIPAGHETFYPADLVGKLEDMPDIPPVPAANGTYTIQAVRSNTGVTVQWVTG